MTLFLPILNLELPTENFAFKRLKEYKQEMTRDGEIPFEMDILHKPTGFVVAVEDTGRGGPYFYGVCTVNRKTPVPVKTQQEVLQEWHDFTKSCLPALRKEARSSAVEAFRTLYDGEDHRQDSLNDAVVSLFHNEYVNQASYSRKRKMIVRVFDELGEFKDYTYNTNNVDVLRNSKIKGSYWDKASKSWIDI